MNLSDDDDDLPPMVDGAIDNDEGFVDAEEGDMYESINPYGGYGDEQGPVWSFEGIGSNTRNNDSDDAASDAPNLGSEGEHGLGSRILEDFGDEMVMGHPGEVTPVDDDEVHEIRVPGE